MTGSAELIWLCLPKEKSCFSCEYPTQQGLNSLIILGAWILWKNRDDCVFNGVTTSLSKALSLAGEASQLWGMAGPKGLSFITAPSLGN